MAAPHDKKALSERDICTKYITPAIAQAGWDIHAQLSENYNVTAGEVIVRGRASKRKTPQFADYVLWHKPGIPLAIVEAKDNSHTVAAGIQQALRYAEMIDAPFAFSSNGDGFLLHDRTGAAHQFWRARLRPNEVCVPRGRRHHDSAPGAGRPIVARVEHLLSLCDALEASLRRAEDRASRYAEAVVRELVA